MRLMSAGRTLVARDAGICVEREGKMPRACGRVNYLSCAGMASTPHRGLEGTAAGGIGNLT